MFKLVHEYVLEDINVFITCLSGYIMRLSESLRKNIFEASVGGIINKLKIRKRRSTFFFEEIYSEYVKACEDAGYGKEMMEISREWMIMSFERIVLASFKKIPPIILLNTIMKKLWIMSGLMDNFNASKDGRIVTIRTMNEAITRFIERNQLTMGFYIGVLSSLFMHDLKPVNIVQTKTECEYKFRLLDKKPVPVRSKDKPLYDRLNRMKEVRGFTLKDLLEKKVFHLKGKNRTYFRGKLISPIENTLFHLIGNRKILLDKVPEISYNYFKDVIKDSSDAKKLSLIKTILQAMGWGIIKIAAKDKRIIFEIKNPPYGLQAEEDNWDFLIRTILGYLWLLNKGFRIKQVKTDYKRLWVEYSF